MLTCRRLTARLKFRLIMRGLSACLVVAEQLKEEAGELATRERSRDRGPRRDTVPAGEQRRGKDQGAGQPQPVVFQNSATGVDLGVYAARRYSLMRPPRTGRRLIRFCERSAMGWSARGGRSSRLRWGRRPL